MITITTIKQWYYNPKTEIPKAIDLGCERIPDVKKTIQSLIQVLDAHPDFANQKGYSPYFDQLKEIYLKLTTKNKQ